MTKQERNSNPSQGKDEMSDPIRNSETAIERDTLGGPTKISFDASYPAHVERGPGKTPPNDSTAFYVPGEVPAKPSPGGGSR